MKRFQRSLALLLALMMILTAFSATALAATSYKVATLKRGTWYKLPDDVTTVYKLVLAADSIITTNWKNATEESYIFFCKDSKCTNRVFEIIGDNVENNVDVVSVVKGTYYIYMETYADNPKVQVKFTVQKAANKANYCRAKAITLKRNQLVKIAQTPHYCYSRWYRINLTKKKTVTITTNEGKGSYIQLYDSKMKRISCAYGDRTVITEDPIKSGTYFIRVNSSESYYEMGEYTGDYITFKWK